MLSEVRPMTQEQVAELKGISKRRVQQLEARAIAKLRAVAEWEAFRRGMTLRQYLLEDTT